MSLSRKSLNPNPLVSAVRRRPFLFFGLPFLAIVVGSSFALQEFTQTRYDLDDQKRRSVSKEEELGMSKDRKKIDIREEYFRLNAEAGGDDASLSALSSTGSTEPAPAAVDALAARKKKKFSMAPTSQDDYEPVRVPRPAGLPEWGGGVAGASEDAPIKGHRKEDRWV